MGIGAQVAAQLPREGHGITVFDIAQPTAPIDHPVETNFSNPRSVSAALKANGDRCDIAINNAGMPPGDGRLENSAGQLCWLDTVPPTGCSTTCQPVLPSSAPYPAPGRCDVRI